MFNFGVDLLKVSLSVIPFNLSFGCQVLSDHFEKFVGVGVDFEGIRLVGGFFGLLVGMFVA